MNNWLHTASALAVTICGALLAFNWGGAIADPHTVGYIVTGLGAIKAVASVISPSSPVDPVTGK